jgi:hypothetical protein
VIVCHTFNGLANRLRAAVSGLILGQHLARPVRLIWPLGQGMHCPFDALFEPSGIEFLEIPEDFFATARLRTPRDYLPAGTRVWRDRLGSLTGEQYDHVEQTPFILTSDRLKDLPETLYIRTCFAYRPESLTPDQYEEAFSETLRERFRPRKKILDSVMDLPKNTVGVHVRLGDKRSNPVLRHRKVGSAVENFHAAMDAFVASEPDVRFFVCSDDEGAKAQLRARYEERVFTYPATVQTRDTAAGMRDALRDLYTLAQTRMILADGDSSFGPVAARYLQRPIRNMRPDFQGPGRIGTAQAAITSMVISKAGRLWRRFAGRS